MIGGNAIVVVGAASVLALTGCSAERQVLSSAWIVGVEPAKAPANANLDAELILRRGGRGQLRWRETADAPWVVRRVVRWKLNSPEDHNLALFTATLAPALPSDPPGSVTGSGIGTEGHIGCLGLRVRDPAFPEWVTQVFLWNESDGRDGAP